VVANEDWCNLYKGVEVEVGVTIRSDHLPIFVSSKSRLSSQKHSRKFRYEAAWEVHDKCCELVANSWEHSQTNGADPWSFLGGGGKWKSA
jgi:hypothetical protein